MAKPAMPPQPPHRFESLVTQSLPIQPVPAQPLPASELPSTSPSTSLAPESMVMEARVTRPASGQIVHQTSQGEIVAVPPVLPSPLPSSIPQPLPPSPQQLAHRQVEQRTMQDVQLLLETMFTREDSTVRLILDRLYDIGSVNLVNQRVSNRYLNQIARWVACCSRPVAKLLIMRWFKRNCPRLISNWLYNQVKFEPKQLVQAAAQMPPTEAQQPTQTAQDTAKFPEAEVYRKQVHQLHSRVRTLTILLIGVTFTLGGSLAWAVWQQSAWRTRSQSFPSPRPAALLHSTPPTPQPPN